MNDIFPGQVEYPTSEWEFEMISSKGRNMTWRAEGNNVDELKDEIEKEFNEIFAPAETWRIVSGSRLTKPPM